MKISDTLNAKSSLGPTGPRSKGGTKEILVIILRQGDRSFPIFSWGRHLLPCEVPGGIEVQTRTPGREEIQRAEWANKCPWFVSNLLISTRHSLQSRRNRIPPAPAPACGGGAPSLSSATRSPAGPPKSGGRQTREAPKWASSLAQASPQLHGNIPHHPGKERFLSGFGLKKRKKRLSRSGGGVVGWANGKQGTGSEAAEGPGYPERSVLLGRGFKATSPGANFSGNFGQSFSPALSLTVLRVTH